MKIERIVYFFLGNNVVIGPHAKRRLEFLRGKVPPGFKHRQMDDLGCGDGKITLLLKEIFLPTRLRGFDINPRQVRRAKGRGIEAEVKNLEENMPTGELAVMWGVLHHMEDIEACLKRVKENYALIFIKEPIKNGVIKWLGELGHPLRKRELEYLVEKHLAGSQIFYYDNSILIFYTSPKRNRNLVRAEEELLSQVSRKTRGVS